MKDPMGSMAKFVRLSLQFANGQIETLNYIGPGTMRASLINDLRNKVLHLEQLVEETERSVIEEIEAMSDSLVSTAAKVSEMYIMSEKNKNDVELTRISEKELVGRLNEMEKGAEKIVGEYFKGLKEPIIKTLETIDKLPR